MRIAPAEADKTLFVPFALPEPIPAAPYPPVAVTSPPRIAIAPVSPPAPPPIPAPPYVERHPEPVAATLPPVTVIEPHPPPLRASPPMAAEPLLPRASSEPVPQISTEPVTPTPSPAANAPPHSLFSPTSSILTSTPGLTRKPVLSAYPDASTDMLDSTTEQPAAAATFSPTPNPSTTNGPALVSVTVIAVSSRYHPGPLARYASRPLMLRPDANVAYMWRSTTPKMYLHVTSPVVIVTSYLSVAAGSQRNTAPVSVAFISHGGSHLPSTPDIVAVAFATSPVNATQNTLRLSAV